MNKNVDSQSVDQLFAKLSQPNRDKLMFGALKEGGKVLQRQTQESLVSKNIKTNTPNRWNGKTLLSGIRLKYDAVTDEVVVHIMGDFRLKFFERGTAIRHTKDRKGSSYLEGHSLKRNSKGRNTGTIKATNFFKKARENEQPINDAIEKYLNNEFDKLK